MAARAAASDGDTLLALALTRDVLPLKPGLVSGSLNSSTGEGLVLADLSSDWFDQIARVKKHNFFVNWQANCTELHGKTFWEIINNNVVEQFKITRKSKGKFS